MVSHNHTVDLMKLTSDNSFDLTGSFSSEGSIYVCTLLQAEIAMHVWRLQSRVSQYVHSYV